MRNKKNNDNEIAVILLQSDPDVDALLPSAYMACPFNAVLSSPKSFYHQASQSLRSPRLLFFFVTPNYEPKVKVVGGDAIRTMLYKESMALQSNALLGMYKIVCGTQTLQMVQDPVEHKRLQDLVSVLLSAKSVKAIIPQIQAICQECIQDMVVRSSSNEICDIDDNDQNTAVVTSPNVTQAIALDVVYKPKKKLIPFTPQHTHGCKESIPILDHLNWKQH